MIIFGGRTGEGLTQIIPKDYVSGDISYQYGECEHSTYTDNHKQAVSSDSNGHDSVDEAKSDNNGERSKGKEKEAPTYDESCLYLGHVGESHYVSLRKKDWRKRLEQGTVTMMDGGMTSDFTSFSTVFQRHQDDGRMIIKGCLRWKSRWENPQKLTQLSPRSLPRHLVGNRAAQKDTIIDTTSLRWNPA